MATYGGWTEMREYRVWQAEDVYACITVDKHKNGWYMVQEDGSDTVVKTRDETYAFRHALYRMGVVETEARESCWCLTEDAEAQEECADAARNVYGDPHGVRTQVVDMIENRSLDECEL